MNWIPAVFRRRKLFDDLSEEMRLQIEERVEQLMREPGMGCSMVPLIQLSTVELAQMATASITIAVVVNPEFLRSCREAKRTS